MYCFGKFCLLCTTETKNLVYIYTRSEFDINTNYLDMIEVLYPRLIELNSTLPDFICKFCLTELINAYFFYKKCQRTENILKQYIQVLFIPNEERNNKRKLHFHEDMSIEFFFEVKRIKYSESITRSFYSNNLVDLNHINTDFKSLDHISNTSTILLEDYQKEFGRVISNISFSEKVENILSTKEKYVNNIFAFKNFEKNSTMNNIVKNNMEIEKKNPEISVNKNETIVYLADISETESEYTKSSDYISNITDDDDSDYRSESSYSDSDSNEEQEKLTSKSSLTDTNNPEHGKTYTKYENETEKYSKKQNTENLLNRADILRDTKTITKSMNIPELYEDFEMNRSISPKLRNKTSDTVTSLESNNKVSKNTTSTSLSDINICYDNDLKMIENNKVHEENSEVTKYRDENKKIVIETKLQNVESITRNCFVTEINNEVTTTQEEENEIKKIESSNESITNITNSIKEINNHEVIISQQHINKKLESKSENCTQISFNEVKNQEPVKEINNLKIIIPQQNKNKTLESKNENNIENFATENNNDKKGLSQQENKIIKFKCKDVNGSPEKEENNYEKQKSALKIIGSINENCIQDSVKQVNNSTTIISQQQSMNKMMESKKENNIKTHINKLESTNSQQLKPLPIKNLKSESEIRIQSFVKEVNNEDITMFQERKQSIIQKFDFKSKSSIQNFVKEINNREIDSLIGANNTENLIFKQPTNSIKKVESKNEDGTQNSFKELNSHEKNISKVLNLTKTFSEIEIVPLRESTRKKFTQKDIMLDKRILNLPEIVISLCNNKDT